ncbi:MAG: hypothetical protein NZM11_03175 [Anaerolineales bacterium]|nr:hypothetical protein [Anaerolineales bacterium]
MTYAGKERLIEAPANLSVGRLAEIVGQAFAPFGSSADGVRYELRSAGISLPENDRIGRVCVSIQPGRALELHVVREREPAPAESTVPALQQGSLSDVVWVLGGRALAAAGAWGVYLWDAETQRWQEKPAVTLPVLHVAAYERFLVCIDKQGMVAVRVFDDAKQSWHGRAHLRLTNRAITGIALSKSKLALGAEQGNLYWLSFPDLEGLWESPPKSYAPVRLMHWINDQHCLSLQADGVLAIWRPDEMQLAFESRLSMPAGIIGAANVGGVSANAEWILMMLAEPMRWVWVTLGCDPITLDTADALPSSGQPISMVYGSKSRLVWVGFSDGVVQAWSVRDAGQPLEHRARYHLGISRLRKVLLSRDEQCLISIDGNNQIGLHAIQNLQVQ